MRYQNHSLSNASFSECGFFRWNLQRTLSNRKNKIIFVGLNPSKASKDCADPTLKRLMSFSKRFGYGSLIVVNLFARVGSSPSILRKCSDPVGKNNDRELFKYASEWSRNPLNDLWLGWGNKGVWHNRNVDVMRFLKKHSINRLNQYPHALGPLALGVTRKGHPRHPLYASYREVLRPFNLN